MALQQLSWIEGFGRWHPPFQEWSLCWTGLLVEQVHREKMQRKAQKAEIRILLLRILLYTPAKPPYRPLITRAVHFALCNDVPQERQTENYECAVCANFTFYEFQDLSSVQTSRKSGSPCAAGSSPVKSELFCFSFKVATCKWCIKRSEDDLQFPGFALIVLASWFSFSRFSILSFILLQTATALNPLSAGNAARKCFSLQGLRRKAEKESGQGMRFGLCLNRRVQLALAVTSTSRVTPPADFLHLCRLLIHNIFHFSPSTLMYQTYQTFLILPTCRDGHWGSHSPWPCRMSKIPWHKRDSKIRIT